jgi:FAD/FMN-containing dehydrogenase
LSNQFNDQVSFPNETFYDYELSQFWSLQQSETYPACIFRPSDGDEVAVAILVAEATNCRFAAKSGGHASFSGASNIAGGITIDFADLNEITVSSDRSTVSIGPGNTWYDVYTTLEPQNLIVIGGRVAGIGVGGLTLGGKAACESFLS